MKKILILFVAFFCLSCTQEDRVPHILYTKQSLLPVWNAEYLTTKSEIYTSKTASEETEIQCPIPRSDRVFNYTGVQCVYSSIETIGRWAECKQLINPPITSRADCKSFANPGAAASRLNALGVRFEQSYTNKAQGIALIKKAMAERRGCMFGVPGHAMVLVHYDEEKNVAKWIDNVDRNLSVQTMTVDQFKRYWDVWVLVIYADPDIIPAKTDKTPLANKIPIIDRNNPQGQYGKDYIPAPLR